MQPACRKNSVYRRRQFPTTSRWSATQRTGIPGSPASVRNRRGGAAALRSHRSHPADGAEWRADVLGTSRLARVLNDQRDLAMLFRTLATLRTDAPLFASVDELLWRDRRLPSRSSRKAIEAPELVRRARGRSRARALSPDDSETLCCVD